MMLTKWYSCGFNHIIINLHVQMSPSCLGYLYNQITKTIVYLFGGYNADSWFISQGEANGNSCCGRLNKLSIVLIGSEYIFYYTEEVFIVWDAYFSYAKLE